MAPSVLSNQEDQVSRISLEASRSSRSKTSGETIAARSLCRDGKGKRVSFIGFNPFCRNEKEGFSIRNNTDTPEESLQTLVPVCRKVRLAKKMTAITPGMTGKPPWRQTFGNSNRNQNTKYPNIAQLNVTDSSNVRRTNRQEYPRSPILRAAEKRSHDQVQPKSNSERCFQGLYWRMSAPGARQSNSRRFPKQTVNIQGKCGRTTESNKTTHNLRPSPTSNRVSNFPYKRSDVYGRRLKQTVNQRTVKVPAFVYNSQIARKAKISNMLLRSSGLSAFRGNETPLNHTGDFQQYIQLTRSGLHPFDVQRIRQDGSPVDTLPSNNRTNLQNGQKVKTVYRHFTDSKQVVHSSTKPKHSSSEFPSSHEKRKLTKQRDTGRSNSTRQKGHLREKGGHREGQLNRNSDERFEKGKSSKLEKHQTDRVSALTSAKQLQSKLVLEKSTTPGERTHARTVESSRTATVKGDLHIIVNSEQSSQTGRHVYSTMSSSLLRDQPGQTVSSQTVQCNRYANVETGTDGTTNQTVQCNRYANVETGTDGTIKQTTPGVESTDVSHAREFPTFAAQQRNAAYLSYVKTGRRARLLEHIIEVVLYDGDRSVPGPGDLEVVSCDGQNAVPSGGDSGSCASDISADTLQSATANKEAKIDARANLKPASRKCGGLKKRCSQSRMIAMTKLQGGGEQVCNVTDNSSTGRRSASRMSQKNPPGNRQATRESMSQTFLRTRKSRCGTPKRPRKRRKLKLVDSWPKPPSGCVRLRSPVAPSRRRRDPSQRKCRRKSSNVKGDASHTANDASHNANIKLDNAKCEPTKNVEEINQLNDPPNNKCKSYNNKYKSCDLLDNPQQDQTAQHERPKLRKCKRRRRRNKQAKYFMKSKQTNSNNEETKTKTFPQAKPFQTDHQIGGYNLVMSAEKRAHFFKLLHECKNLRADGSSLIDASGGLSGTSRLGTLGVSRQDMYKLVNCLLDPWEKLLTTEDTSSDNEDSTARDSGTIGHNTAGQRLGRQINTFTHKPQTEASNDELKYLHGKYMHSQCTSSRPTAGSR